jgi:hypothetical protein
MSRRWGLLAYLLAVVAVVAIAITGCGDGGQSVARQYARNGDALYKVATGIGLKLDDAKAQIQRLMVSNDLAGLQAIRPQIEGLLAKMDTSQATIDKALAQYRKVSAMQGVDDYKQYVSLQSEAALKEQQALSLGKQLVDFLTGQLDAANASKPVNPTDSLKAVNSSINTLDELERQIDSLKRDAKNFARDNDLF